MKLILDNNISHRVASLLDVSFDEFKHVSFFGLNQNTDDSTIWNFAKKQNYCILTKDNDFEALSRLLGCPPKVRQLICGNKSTKEITDILKQNLEAIHQFGKDENCLLFLL
jgi:predicted nuclease of predicted toxin-antitoxin system